LTLLFYYFILKLEPEQKEVDWKMKLKTNKETERLSRKVLTIGLLTIFIASAILPVASAKYYYYRFGHRVVRYEYSDIPLSLQKYIDMIEYDLVYTRGEGYGARLYLTWRGRILCSWSQAGGYYIAIMIAKYVQSLPEWKGDRSLNSVYREIRYHSPWYYEINIEYYYNDLPYTEKSLFGR